MRSRVGEGSKMTLKLKFACGAYDRTMPFWTGDIKPKDIDLAYTPQAPELTFLQQLKDMRYDVSEMSMSAYVQMRAKGREDFIALPVFPSRVFRHSALYVRTDSDIRHPEQLRGKRVGIGYYQMSGAGMGARCTHGRLWREAERDEPGYRGMELKASPAPIRSIQLADMVEGTKQSKPKLELMLEAGEIDALVSVHTPAQWRAMKERSAICSKTAGKSRRITFGAPASSR